MTNKQIIVNGIDVTKCEHFRLSKDKDFFCKKGTYECYCNPSAMECSIYITHLKTIIQRLEKEKIDLQIQLQNQKYESCHFDKIKEITGEM